MSTNAEEILNILESVYELGELTPLSYEIRRIDEKKSPVRQIGSYDESAIDNFDDFVDLN